MSSSNTQTMEFGGHSMVGDLQSVLVHRPSKALGDADPKRWHYTSAVHLPQAIIEHDNFVAILRQHGADVIYHDQEHDEFADAIFVHDPAWITNQGAVLLNMGKALRSGEVALMEKTFLELNIPIIGKIKAPGRVEGGDLLWLNEQTLLAGRGFRTNETGIRQLRDILAPQKVAVLAYDLPYFQGKEACLHLQSLISFVDVKTALIYSPLLPTALYELLQENEYRLIAVPEAEFYSMGPNTLAIKPKLVLSITGNPITQQRLAAAGITVLTYTGAELSLKTEGGPTCLTRPLKRKRID